MFALVIVSVIWAFSFGLIRKHLVHLDSSSVAALRLLLAWLVFLPWLRFRGLSARLRLLSMAIGAVQFGLMYLLYLEAFRWLEAYQIAVLTLFTPVFVCLFDDALNRRFEMRPLGAALLSVLGAGIILAQRPLGQAEWLGIFLVQASNACFAMGQLLYCRLRRQHPEVADSRLFAWLYLGAVLLAVPYAAGQLPHTLRSLTLTQGLVIAYLGLIASGVAFFLWNYGATRVKTGTLAVMNNAKIPLGVLTSLLVFGEQTHWLRLGLGALLLLLGIVLVEGRRT